MRNRREPVPIERADEHLDQVSEVTTLILKGHLLVEEALYAAVQDKFPSPQFFMDANLRFAQLLAIAKGFFFDNEHAPVWDAIQALNSIRNRLAHRLEPDDVAVELRRLAFLMPVPRNISFRHPEATRFINVGLGAILGYLWMLPAGRGSEANPHVQPTPAGGRG